MILWLAKAAICISVLLLCYAAGEAVALIFWPKKQKRKYRFHVPAPIDIKTLRPAEEHAEYSAVPQSVDGDSALKEYLRKTTEKERNGA